MLIVLAVYWPPQAPAPGHAADLDLVQLLGADLARAVGADRLVDARRCRCPCRCDVPGQDRAVVEDHGRDVQAADRHGRAGAGLVAADEADEAVEQVAAATSSIESATTSRLTSEAFMPSVPMVTPSLTEMVLNSMGVPPAARMPSLTCSARSRWLRLQGIVSIHCVATPMMGLREVLVGEADGLEHRPRAGAVGAVGEGGGVALGGIGRVGRRAGTSVGWSSGSGGGPASVRAGGGVSRTCVLEPARTWGSDPPFSVATRSRRASGGGSDRVVHEVDALAAIDGRCAGAERHVAPLASVTGSRQDREQAGHRAAFAAAHATLDLDARQDARGAAAQPRMNSMTASGSSAV